MIASAILLEIVTKFWHGLFSQKILYICAISTCEIIGATYTYTRISQIFSIRETEITSLQRSFFSRVHFRKHFREPSLITFFASLKWRSFPGKKPSHSSFAAFKRFFFSTRARVLVHCSLQLLEHYKNRDRPKFCKPIYFGDSGTLHIMAIRVVEFSNGEYKIRKVFA